MADTSRPVRAGRRFTTALVALFCASLAIAACGGGSKKAETTPDNKGDMGGGDLQDILANPRVEPAEKPLIEARRGGKPPATTMSQHGLTLSELSEAQRSELKVSGGVLVENVQGQGAAARAGIRRGDVILAVNNQDIKSVEQFNQLMAQFDKGRIVALLVRRGTNSLYIPFRVDVG